MSAVVLVHGAWQGAWCWDRLVPNLEEAGHSPTAIDLSGCGTRAPITPDVELADHVADVVAAADAVADERFVLVVHYVPPAGIDVGRASTATVRTSSPPRPAISGGSRPGGCRFR